MFCVQCCMCCKRLSSTRCRFELIDSAWVVVPGQKCIKKKILLSSNGKKIFLQLHLTQEGKNSSARIKIFSQFFFLLVLKSLYQICEYGTPSRSRDVATYSNISCHSSNNSSVEHMLAQHYEVVSRIEKLLFATRHLQNPCSLYPRLLN